MTIFLKKRLIFIVSGSILLLLACAIAAILYGKQYIARYYVERTIKNSIGLRFAIDYCEVSILNTDARVRELAIFNPKDYQEKIMLDIAEIYADFDAPSLLHGKPYLKDLRVHVDEIFIIKNKEGVFNLEALAVVKATKEGKKPKEITGVAPLEINIDSFELKIRKVVYKDYTQPILPLIIEKELNINERYENIQNPSSVMRIILVEAIKKAALEQLIPISLQAISKPISGILDTAKRLGQGTVSVFQQTGKQLGGAVKVVTGTGQKDQQQSTPARDNPIEGIVSGEKI